MEDSIQTQVLVKEDSAKRVDVAKVRW
jgi:hypothetical protein